MEWTSRQVSEGENSWWYAICKEEKVKRLRVLGWLQIYDSRSSPSGCVVWFNSADGGSQTPGLNTYKLEIKLMNSHMKYLLSDLEKYAFKVNWKSGHQTVKHRDFNQVGFSTWKLSTSDNSSVGSNYVLHPLKAHTHTHTHTHTHAHTTPLGIIVIPIH